MIIGAKIAALLVATSLAASVGAAQAADDAHIHIARQPWTFSGLFGKFDDAQLQRGFKVYTEVCARCHGVRRLFFRNLAQPGGPGFSEAQAKSLAATYQVDAAPNDEGKIVKRPAILADFPAAVPQRAGSALRPEWCTGPRSIADRQGARRRRRHAVLSPA